MKLFKWIGTEEEAQRIIENASNDKIIFLKNDDEALLLQEADESSFEHVEAYEVLDRTGEFSTEGFAVLNNIPVTEEGRELFEQRFRNRAGLIEEEPGFIAIRVLKPLETDTYVILTMWKDEASFKGWQQSQAYNKAHAKRGTNEGIDKRPNIFARPSFVTTYR